LYHYNNPLPDIYAAENSRCHDKKGLIGSAVLRTKADNKDILKGIFISTQN